MDTKVTEPATESAEVWRDIAGTKFRYAVSTLGRVRRNRSARILKPYSITGYQAIRTSEGGVATTRYVHDLVSETFIGVRACKKTQQVNHKNGIKTDNRLENLEYCTGSSNVRHASAVGLRKCRLNREQVIAILGAVLAGEKYKSIAARYGISIPSVSDLVNGRTYQWVLNPSEYDKALASKVVPS